MTDDTREPTAFQLLEDAARFADNAGKTEWAKSARRAIKQSAPPQAQEPVAWRKWLRGEIERIVADGSGSALYSGSGEIMNPEVFTEAADAIFALLFRAPSAPK